MLRIQNKRLSITQNPSFEAFQTLKTASFQHLRRTFWGTDPHFSSVLTLFVSPNFPWFQPRRMAIFRPYGSLTVISVLRHHPQSVSSNIKKQTNDDMLNSRDFRTSQRGKQKPQNSPFYVPSQRKLFSQSEKKFFLVREKKNGLSEG